MVHLGSILDTFSLITSVYPDLVRSSLTLPPEPRWRLAHLGLLSLSWLPPNLICLLTQISVELVQGPNLLAHRGLCIQTGVRRNNLMLGIIPIEQLQGNLMVDNWRQEWEKAAQKVLNTQSYGCWSVNADSKLASVSQTQFSLQFWKILFP